MPQIAQRILTMAIINSNVIESYKNSIAGTPADMTTFEPAAYQCTLSTSNYNTLGLLKPASCKLLKYISAGLVDKRTGGYLLFGDYRALQFLWLCLCLQRLRLQRLALQRLVFFVGGGGALPLAMGKGKHLGGGGGSSTCNWGGKTWGGGGSSACCMWFCTCSCICLCLCSLNTVLGLWHFMLWHIMKCYTAPFHSMLYLSLTGLSCAFVAVCSTSGAQKNAYLIKAAMHALAGDLVNAIDMLQQAGLKPQDAIVTSSWTS